jgi:hypothetical protein
MTSRRSPMRRSAARVVVGMALVAGSAAACTSASGSSPTTAAHGVSVVAPDLTLQGCTYAVDDSVPTGEPKGLQPHFAAFSPDAAAGAALEHIQQHGGAAMVDGAGIPAGTHLYAGPDVSGDPVGTVPAGRSILMAEPVVWTDTGGGTWFAFFLQCGGSHLYWASVRQLTHQNQQAGHALSETVAQLRAAAPYSKTDQASMMPVTVDRAHHLLVWKDARLKFPVGRGQLISVTN